MEIKSKVLEELRKILFEAEKLGLCAIEITSGSMEKRLGLSGRDLQYATH